MGKYGAKKTIVDGITFDSRKEAKRYCVLKGMEKEGIISDLLLQPKFELIPSQYRVVNGKWKCVERPCSYIGDFSYIQNGKRIVEDAKGFRTPVYKLKRKLLLYVHDVEVKEV